MKCEKKPFSSSTILLIQNLLKKNLNEILNKNVSLVWRRRETFSSRIDFFLKRWFQVRFALNCKPKFAEAHKILEIIETKFAQMFNRFSQTFGDEESQSHNLEVLTMDISKFANVNFVRKFFDGLLFVWKKSQLI